MVVLKTESRESDHHNNEIKPRDNENLFPAENKMTRIGNIDWSKN